MFRLRVLRTLGLDRVRPGDEIHRWTVLPPSPVSSARCRTSGDVPETTQACPDNVVQKYREGAGCVEKVSCWGVPLRALAGGFEFAHLLRSQRQFSLPTRRNNTQLFIGCRHWNATLRGSLEITLHDEVRL